jgi:hypothetical protein
MTKKGQKIKSMKGPPYKPFKGTYGSGERFKHCVATIQAKDKKAACAALGRAAHGKKSFQKAAAKGRKKK